MVRNTQQGNAIRQMLKKAGRPLSAQEVHSMAQKKVPGLGIATVYRNLKIAATGRVSGRGGITRPAAPLGINPGKTPPSFSLQYLRQII